MLSSTQYPPFSGLLFQNQLESVQERCYEFEVKNAKLQEELDKDIETRMQVRN